jgi:hypothetical protein
LKAPSIILGGTLNLSGNAGQNGGDGGVGGNAGDRGGGGGGGGGGGAGTLYVTYNALTNTSATLLMAGGAGGTLGANGVGGAAGERGINGTLNLTLGLLGIHWGTNLTNISQNWNTSIILRANATTQSNDCSVQNYTTNDTLYPINRTTGVINISAFNRSLALTNRSIAISATDNCSVTITQSVWIALSYHTPSVLAVNVTPNPTGTKTPLTCSLTLNNTDNANLALSYDWFRNTTRQSALQNQSVVAVGNLSLADTWICSSQLGDNVTLTPWVNSTALTLADTTRPVLQNFTQSNSAPIISSGTDTFTVNVTDNEAISSVMIEIVSNSFNRQNFTATLQGDGTYQYMFSPGLTETYNATAYTTDTSGNVNISPVLQFTPVTGTGGSGGGGGGGGGGGTTIIVQSNGTYTFASTFVDKGVFFMWSFDERSYTFNEPIDVTKTTTSCSADPPFTCSVINNGTQVLLTYIEADHEFPTKTITGELRATSDAGDVAKIQAKVQLLNAGYSVFGSSSTPLPQAFIDFPYLLRVKDGHYAGVRFAAIIALFVGGFLLYVFLKWLRNG